MSKSRISLATFGHLVEANRARLQDEALSGLINQRKLNNDVVTDHELIVQKLADTDVDKAFARFASTVDETEGVAGMAAEDGLIGKAE